MLQQLKLTYENAGLFNEIFIFKSKDFRQQLQ